MKSSSASGRYMVNLTGNVVWGFSWDMALPVNREGHPTILGSHLNGGQGGLLLRHSIQGPPRGHPGGNSIPHHL